MTVHVFPESIDASRKYAAAPWWEEVYSRAFGRHESVYIAEDGPEQRLGIDRKITLASGKVVTVDEKVREKDWPDILLERWSDYDQRTPGWIQKPLYCDYIAYAFVPSRRCYLFPFLPLRRAWREHGHDWIDECERLDKFVYARSRCGTRSWVTQCVPVLIPVLFRAINEAQVVEWRAEPARREVAA